MRSDTLAGQLTEHVGWLAFDAGRPRPGTGGSKHAARQVGDDRVSVVVPGSMSQQASELGRSTEAIEAAQQAAKQWGTPRLHSVLLAWEAIGHARDGDERASGRALNRAETLLGTGRRDEDPAWLVWWDEADLAWHEMCAAQNLGKLPLAERCSRDALATVRPELGSTPESTQSEQSSPDTRISRRLPSSWNGPPLCWQRKRTCPQIRSDQHTHHVGAGSPSQNTLPDGGRAKPQNGWCDDSRRRRTW